MPAQRRWLTCTPVRFKGDHTFFARDSGLLCKGFQEIGVACQAVMPGPPMEGDQVGDLIRTDYCNLEDSAWWRSLGVEGVVFYGWGSGRYVPIVRAIKQADIFLVTHMDTGGLFSIFNGVSELGGALWRTTVRGGHAPVSGLVRFAARLAYAASIGVIRSDLPRLRHLRQADCIGTVSPIAVERVRKVCRGYGGKALAAKVRLISHPCPPYMSPDPLIARERLVVAIGRWDDVHVKGTDLLLAATGLVCERDRKVVFEIYGPITDPMRQWHSSLAVNVQSHVRLAGRVPNTELRRALQRARVSLCTSLRESYHGASAEALCCGCSVVGPDVPEIPSMKWFTDGPFGQMAARSPDAMADAMLRELSAWDAGERNPATIGSHWGAVLHAPKVAARILELADTRTHRPIR